ncbi:MAG: hypothetical protein H7843_07280 [Nitrospirota bacterium]
MKRCYGSNVKELCWVRCATVVYTVLKDDEGGNIVLEIDAQVVAAMEPYKQQWGLLQTKV